MSESALEAPRIESETAAREGERAPAEPGSRRHVAAVWWAVGLALVGVAIGLVVWAGTRPSYDAYGWLVWGYQTLHGTLDLGGAPSWKPLPYVFTVPFALAGRSQLWLWMVCAVALSLAGSIFAGRIAYRLTLAGTRGDDLTQATRGRRYGAWVAAVFAGLALLGTEDYMHYILSVQSDPVIVACVLGAIDAHLSGRRRWAFGLMLLASLGRPEAWPWLGLYAVWAWLRVPKMRWLIVAGAAVLLFMWFGIPTITNGRPFVSAQLAFNSPRELHHNQILGTLGRFTELYYLPIWLAALAAVIVAVVRRNWIVLALSAGAVGWVIVEIAFALHGWPALPRYMFEAGGVAAVLAGVVVGWALSEGARLRRGLPGWIGVPAVALLVAALVPGAIDRLRTERHDLRHERGRGTEIRLLGPLIAGLGGPAHIQRCAKPVVDVAWVSALAWQMNMDVGFLGRHPDIEMHRTAPVAIFTPLVHGGWLVTPYHLHRHNLSHCRGLRSKIVPAPGRPDGVLIHASA